MNNTRKITENKFISNSNLISLKNKKEKEITYLSTINISLLIMEEL